MRIELSWNVGEHRKSDQAGRPTMSQHCIIYYLIYDVAFVMWTLKCQILSVSRPVAFRRSPRVA